MIKASGLKSDSNVSRETLVPTNAAKLFSGTSEAYDCFTNQQFSNKLQAFMVNYVLSVTSYYSIYK